MLRRRLLKPVLLTLVAYAALCALMYVGQRALQYHPDARPVPLPHQWQARGQVLSLDTPDRQRLVAWWLPPQHADAPVFLYLHGNAANLGARTARLTRLAAGGAGVLALSWRGYGGSSGQPHEAGLMVDARTAYAALATRVPAARIVLFGESLGSTVAVMLAAEQPVAALVLDSSFASALDVAQGAYPWLPVRWLLHDTYRADLAAPQVRAPVLQIHCRVDPVTSLASAQRLNALLPGRRPIEQLDDRCHTPPLDRFEPALRRFVNEATGWR
jgi:pimeloyl-ACP methyl ester carboxylesterase